jgi:HSP20 family protein
VRKKPKMSDRWWEKRRKERHPWFDVFREFDRIEKIMNEMMRQAFRSSRSPFETSEKRKSFRPHVYGFSISVDSNGRPKIREFGDLQRSRYGTRIREQREPLVDVLDEEEEVVAVAELPGVQKEDITLHATKDELIIRVDTPKRKYHKELPLPEEVDSKPVKTSYKNGVLEVRFKKKKNGKEEKIRIQ